MKVYNFSGIKEVPNSCGGTALQKLYEKLQQNQQDLFITSYKDSDSKIYGTTTAPYSVGDPILMKINLIMNPAEQTMNNTLEHEGTHVDQMQEGGLTQNDMNNQALVQQLESDAYSAGDTAYPPYSDQNQESYP